MSLLTQVGNNYLYGPNNRYRALDSLGSLTTTFKQRFKQGAVTQLPPGYLYNTVTRRYYSNTSKNRERFKDLYNVDGVLQPATNIFDYDISRVDYRTIVPKYNTTPTRNKQIEEMQNLTALDGWTGVKGFKNITRQGYDSINSLGRIIPVLKEQIKSSGSLKYYISVSGDYIIKPT